MAREHGPKIISGNPGARGGFSLAAAQGLDCEKR